MRRLFVPDCVRKEIAEGAVIAISISGGKDSQAVLISVVNWLRSRNYTNEVIAVHSDLGLVEWEQTKGHCERICRELNIPLHTLVYPGGLHGRIERRKEQLKGQDKPFWPSSAARYCTADTKRDFIDKFLRKYKHVISVEGIRWQEGKVSKSGNKTGRAKKPRWEVRKRLATNGRKAFTWYAIIDWDIEHVWGTYDMSNQRLLLAREYYKLKGSVPKWWPFHVAYAMGNDRLSCSICILGSLNDIQNGVKNNPTVAKMYAAWEQETGFTFKKDLSISGLLN